MYADDALVHAGPPLCADCGMWAGEQCGVVGCYWRGCDSCFDGHMLEQHFFDSDPYRMFRTGLWYDAAIATRAKRAEEICHGLTPKTKLADAGT